MFFKIADFFIGSFSGVVVPICIYLGSKPTVNIYIKLFRQGYLNVASGNQLGREAVLVIKAGGSFLL